MIAIDYIMVSLQYDKSDVNLLAASICNVLLNAEILYNILIDILKMEEHNLGITIYFGIGLILIFIIASTAATVTKKTNPSTNNAINKWNKITIYVIATLQFMLLLLYFTSALVLINPPDSLLFSIWFLIAIAGLSASIYLYVKRQLLPLAIVMLLLSIILFGLGLLMRLFLTM